MENRENISPPQGRIEITEFFPGGRKLIEANPPNSQRIKFDGIATSDKDSNMPTIISVLNKERKVLETSYEISSDGTVIKCKHDPDNPEEIIERTQLEDVLAAGTITKYGPPEERQMEDETTKTTEPVVKRELVLLKKGRNSQ
jgi:hypothetical protein